VEEKLAQQYAKTPWLTLLFLDLKMFNNILDGKRHTLREEI
jgi:hypothetical protein